jgi:hypothetical protein
MACTRYAEVSAKKISQLSADSEPLCLEGVVPGENQEDEGEDGKPIEKSHSPR